MCDCSLVDHTDDWQFNFHGLQEQTPYLKILQEMKN
jgi:hypothetical protein